MAPNAPDCISTTMVQAPVQEDAIKSNVVVAPLKTPPYPYRWDDISPEERAERKRVYFDHGPWCTSRSSSMLNVAISTPGNFLMPQRFVEMAEMFYNFELRTDDVFVITYPKCGTTLTQELVWQILHEMDVEGGKESLITRSPFLEYEALADPKTNKKTPKHIRESITACNNMTRSAPR